MGMLWDEWRGYGVNGVPAPHTASQGRSHEHNSRTLPTTTPPRPHKGEKPTCNLCRNKTPHTPKNTPRAPQNQSEPSRRPPETIAFLLKAAEEGRTAAKNRRKEG